MTSSLETIQELIRRMREQFDQSGAKGLQDNRRAFDIAGAAAVLPEGVTVTPVSIHTSLSGEWLLPADSTTTMPVILYLHGGGYSIGSSLSCRPLCSRLAFHAHCRVFSLNYRLAPEHKFPAALDDAIAAYRWLLQQEPASRIYIAGDSAGGGLTMATLLQIRNEQLPMPAGAMGLSAWLDLECSSASYNTNKNIDLLASPEGLRFVGRAYASKQVNTNPLVSPFYTKDLKGLCPLLIQVGSAETLLDENIHFAEQAKRDGVTVELQVWPNMVHVWHSLYGQIPEAQAAIESIGEWLHRQ